jgi:adenosylcobyric acid synthase
LNGRIFGTYLHGIFDRDSFRHAFLRSARASLQMSAPQELVAWNERREQQLDLLADAFGSALDLDAIFDVAGLSRRAEQAERRLS